MLEYHAHVTVLRGLRATLSSAFSSDPILAAKVADLSATVDADPDAAIMGACIDVIVAHASADGTELELLETAADLWAHGMSIYDDLVKSRTEIEASLLNPTAPNAIELMQSGVSRLDGIRTGALQIAAEAESLKQAISPLRHLNPHARQADAPSKDWSWRDAFLGRRTEAFVRHAFEGTSSREKAFAFGVLSSYAGNTAGSAFLGCVVGGPRRSHRYRDRIARNTVGAWLRSTFNTPDTIALSKHMTFSGPTGTTSFPADLAKILKHAFTETYPSRPAPNLDLGLQRTVRHLELLDAFRRPPVPQPPTLSLVQGGDVTGSMTLMSSSGDPNVPSVGIGLDPDMTPQMPGHADSEKSSGGACLGILIALITLGIALLIYCLGKRAINKKCKVQDFLDEFQGSEEPDPRVPTGISQQQLKDMAEPEGAAHIVQELFNMQMLLWQGFDAALSYLTVTGLLYPDDLLIQTDLYQQFVVTPVRSTWPHREEATAAANYHENPTSPIEQPASSAPPFPPYETPAAFVSLHGGNETHSAGRIAADLLCQILRGEMGSSNNDLDADRGFLHPAWHVAAGTSVHDAVLSVDVLPYKAEN